MATLKRITIPEINQQNPADIYQQVRRQKAKMAGPNGESQSLPDSLEGFLCQILENLHKGKAITIFEQESQVSTIEASRLLGVSRAHLITLLNRKELGYFMVGSHRRLYLKDVLDYKVRRDAARRHTIAALALAEYRENLYEHTGGGDE